MDRPCRVLVAFGPMHTLTDTRPRRRLALAALLLCAWPLRAADAPLDALGVRALFPTRAGGRAWACAWSNGHAGSFGYAVDPDDGWFDCAHGDARYRVDGKGALTASGDMARMYVRNPARRAEWGENLEITVYVTRVRETQPVSYAGLQIFARTNHGTLGKEDLTLCDDRGYGGKVTLDGRWEFEKETAHRRPNGNPCAGTQRPWDELPVGVPVGVKFVLRNQAGGTQVRLELYRDLTDGAKGGAWEKMAGMTDTGDNFGVGAAACKPGVKPELPLLRPLVLPDSESGCPMKAVYFRHEYGTMTYRRASVREIDPLP